MKSPNLRNCQARSKNKGLSEYERRARWLQISPSPTGDRDAGGGQPELERGKLGPREASSTKLQAGTQSLTKIPWDSVWLTSAGRVAARDQLPRRDIRHTGDGRTCCHSGNRVAGTREVIRRTPHLGRQLSPSTWLPELLGPGKGKKCRPIESAPLWTT